MTTGRARGSAVRLASASLGVAALMIAFAPAASAQRVLDLPVDTVVRAAPGTTTVLAEVSVPEGLRGATCTGLAEADNQSSVHPDNDIVVRSGGTSEVLDGVEDSPGEVTLLSGQLVLGDTVVAELVMGPDGIFSGGLSVTLECTPPPSATTAPPTAPDSTAPVEVTTTAPDSTTTPTQQATTTVVQQATTTVPSSTTTSPSVESTTTTPVTSTTEPAADSTTTIAHQTTTTVATSQPGPSGESGGQLPRTGPSDTSTLLTVAASLIVAGAALVLVTRARPDLPTEQRR